MFCAVEGPPTTASSGCSSVRQPIEEEPLFFAAVSLSWSGYEKCMSISPVLLFWPIRSSLVPTSLTFWTEISDILCMNQCTWLEASHCILVVDTNGSDDLTWCVQDSDQQEKMVVRTEQKESLILVEALWWRLITRGWAVSREVTCLLFSMFAIIIRRLPKRLALRSLSSNVVVEEKKGVNEMDRLLKVVSE